MGLLLVLGLKTLQPAAARPADGGQDPGKKFNGRLAQLLPTIKDAIAAAGPLAPQIKQKVVDAGALAAKKDYAKANALIDQAEVLLKALPAAESGPKTLPIWTEAKDQVGAQITKLQTAFRKTGQPLAIQIADKGLNSLTGRLQVGMQVALVEFDSATAERRPQAAAKLLTASTALKRLVETDPVLPLLEDNPFGVMVTIRSSLTEALTAIEKAI